MGGAGEGGRRWESGFEACEGGSRRRLCSSGRRCGDGVSPLFRGPAALPPGRQCPPRPAWTPRAPGAARSAPFRAREGLESKLASERATEGFGTWAGGVEPVFEPAEGSEGADDVDWARITRFLVVCDPPRRYTPVLFCARSISRVSTPFSTPIAVIEADFRRHSTLRPLREIGPKLVDSTSKSPICSSNQ